MASVVSIVELSFLLKTVASSCLKRYKYSTEMDDDSLIYVPLIDVLELLLNKTDIHHEIMKKKTNVPGFYSSYKDGARFLRNPLF